MISFYPGPSQTHSRLPEYIHEAFDLGVPSMNHRSDEFTKIIQDTTKAINNKLGVPKDYSVSFISSATEAWEIISQSFVVERSTHLFNGAFGKKWFEAASKSSIPTVAEEFGINENLPVMTDSISESDVICITQNETSNGTQVSNQLLKTLRKNYIDKLIAVDATSSLGGQFLNFQDADIWFSSVQKCLGLPPGLAVLICSPRAIKKGLSINESSHYNSFTTIYKNSQQHQTTHTPNTLNIFLLNRVLENMDSIQATSERLSLRAKELYHFLETETQFDLLVENEQTRSSTVVALKTSNPNIIRLHTQKNNITLGKGYGQWLKNSVRIANFPAHSDEHFLKLKDCIKNFAW